MGNFNNTWTQLWFLWLPNWGTGANAVPPHKFARPTRLLPAAGRPTSLWLSPVAQASCQNSSNFRPPVLDLKLTDRHYTVSAVSKRLRTSHVVDVSGPVAGSSASASPSLVGAAWPRSSPPTRPSPRPPADRCVERHISNSGPPITCNFSSHEIYTGTLRMCVSY